MGLPSCVVAECAERPCFQPISSKCTPSQVRFRPAVLLGHPGHGSGFSVIKTPRGTSGEPAFHVLFSLVRLVLPLGSLFRFVTGQLVLGSSGCRVVSAQGLEFRNLNEHLLLIFDG